MQITLVWGFCGLSMEAYGKSAQNYVAITDLNIQNLDSAHAIIFTDRLRTELYKTKAFNVVERNQMASILEEQEFQQSDCVSDECLVQVGQLLGVSHMIAGAIARVGETFTINLRAIDVSSGEIVYTDTEDCKCPIDDVLTKSTSSIAAKMAAYFSGTPQHPPSEAPQPGPIQKSQASSKTWLWWAGGAAILGTAAAVTIYWLDPPAEKKETSLGPPISLDE